MDKITQNLHLYINKLWDIISKNILNFIPTNKWIKVKNNLNKNNWSLKIEILEDKTVYINWNSTWILLLILRLLYLYQTKWNDHFHLDDINWCDDWSVELIVEKIDEPY